jgi:hypothetical protein
MATFDRLSFSKVAQCCDDAALCCALGNVAQIQGLAPLQTVTWTTHRFAPMS